MSEVTITIKNFDRLEKMYSNAPKKLAEAISLTLERTGLFSATRVKENITMGTNMWKPPIATGAMRRGIQVTEKQPMKIYVRASDMTPYSKYVHEGTFKMRARPFFTITAVKDAKKVQDFFYADLTKRLDSIFK